MPADLFPAIAAWARVAELGSFTRAAQELGVSASALSQTVRALEARLGVRLLDRTTRRVRVTELGAAFLAQAQPGLQAVDAAVAALAEARDLPAGRLRLNLSRAAADVVLLPHLADFNAAYPDVELDLHFDNGLVDLVAGRFDAGIRLGELLAQDMVAIPLGPPQRLATFASPGYLRQHAAPEAPGDLARHRCLNGRVSGGVAYRWEYQRDGERFEVQTRDSLLCNDAGFLLAAARAGAGIGCAFEALVQDDLASGRLQPLLQPWWPEVGRFFLYCTSRSHMPRKLRVLVDFLRRPEPELVPVPLP
jgi:DNA-binding transcriptional LysR family regulator